jgi:hypothetical protein
MSVAALKLISVAIIAIIINIWIRYLPSPEYNDKYETRAF